MKKALIAAALVFGMAGQAGAVGGVVDVTIYDRAEKRTLPVYYHAGRYFVAGKPGNEYQVNVRNTQAGDVLSVVSVDGINVISGETANWNQTGYLLSPHLSFGIKGWRKSLERVAAFFFTEVDNSYAARSGRPDHAGVIGVAVFRRKTEPAVGITRDAERKRRESAAGEAASDAQGSVNERAAPFASPDAAAPRADKRLGTGHGQSETSVVRYANFERASSTPDEVVTIYYDSYRNLVAQGVIKDNTRVARPHPFPNQFVPDPR